MCLAIPGKVLKVTSDDGLVKTATVDFGGVKRTVNLTFVPEATVGDHVIVHVGFGISIIDEEAAKLTFNALDDWSADI